MIETKLQQDDQLAALEAKLAEHTATIKTEKQESDFLGQQLEMERQLDKSNDDTEVMALRNTLFDEGIISLYRRCGSSSVQPLN
ncbi:MAG: hypothetical protein ABW139_09055 [Candidatus Thiodiazotropha sp. DIVDIV]